MIRTNIFSIKKDKKHLLIKFLGISLRIKYPINWIKIYKFFKHEIKENTVLLIEANDCHHETLFGYYKYLKELGYSVEIITRGMCENLFKSNPEIKLWECDKLTFDFIFTHFNFSKYYCLIFNSKRTYWYNKKFCKENNSISDGFDLSNCYKKIPQGQKENIYVQHHIDMYDKTPKDKQIVLANPARRNDLNSQIVNPHYFGDIKITPKNGEKTKFITVGELNTNRRNSELLLKAVEELHIKGINNFEVIVVGLGQLDTINPALRNYFRIMGRLDFPSMFRVMEEADYFLPLLDPESEKHKRYMNAGTSGSFQLIYGFLKPCIIHKTFADIYGFSEKDSIIYESNSELLSAMKKGIKINQSEYELMQQELNNEVNKIKKESIRNLKRIVEWKKVLS